STTTSSTTTTTNTTLPVCDCAGYPFLASREVKLNNDADIRGSVGANQAGARARLGKNVVMSDGTTIAADQVIIGVASSVDNGLANSLQVGPAAVVRGTRGTPTLPLVTPFCSIPAITCGGQDIQVAAGQTTGPLAPGTYGRVRVLNGGTLLLASGSFTFCD